MDEAQTNKPSSDRMMAVYQSLRELASQRLAAERRGHTLQATALVHDVYLRLADESPERWESTAHFYNAAADSMRKILIDHARAKKRQKRGGEAARVAFELVMDSATLEDTADADDILALDAAMERLEKLSPETGAVVRLRYYAGLSVEQTAAALKISESTIKRKWAYARAWLFRELSAGDAGD